MEHKKGLFTKAHWMVDLVFAAGVVLILLGSFLHPRSWPEVLPRLFIDAGTAIAGAGIIAHLVS